MGWEGATQNNRTLSGQAGGQFAEALVAANAFQIRIEFERAAILPAAIDEAAEHLQGEFVATFRCFTGPVPAIDRPQAT